ncbi:hypothetical protein [Legionella quateirensis]|uniref:Serine/threonine protein kinase n=1 Tax=Legionella quateirensis TaxID=45072 RepID=A0A378KRS9_9GAMM|nr:hypothetical protein [Legionella quateirensis]KTD54691.1 serine/threonine protein kinase [Legionella quateirensis]STY16869.1 serine/threonine protein kinase [Legionella quateirensis]
MRRKLDKFIGGLFKKSPDKPESSSHEEHISSQTHKKTTQAIKAPKIPDVNAMPELKSFDAGELPKDEMKQFRSDVNKLIHQFNKSSDSVQKKQILEQIQATIKAVDCKYPPSMLAESKGYRAAHDTLFNEIKKQMGLLGINSLLPPQSKSSPLAHVVANMSPEKAEELLTILAKGKQSNLTYKLQSIYEKSDTSAEAKSFREFLSNHEISYLGGGNSKNFSVVNKNDQSTLVLKVDCRLDMPRNAEIHLREKLGTSFAPNHAERQLTYNDPDEGLQSRTLLVTEYYSGSDVYDYRKQSKTAPDLASSACDVFSQMADAMLKIQKQGCMFPDAKLTNWLVDKEGKLIIADTKSFVFTDKDGKYSKGLPGNEYSGGLLCTNNFSPPEFDSKGPYAGKVTADSTHAFILGKNLYTFVTGKFEEKDNGYRLDFSSEAFKTGKGVELKKLIQDLVKPNPEDRISVAEAHSQLFNIIKNEIFNDLESLKFGSKDATMNRFISDKKEQLDAAKNNPAEQSRIINELKSTVTALKADEAANEVRNIANNYRNKAGLFTVGMNEKADKIESAMSKVPIEARKNLLASPESKEVLQALASHRYIGKRGNVYFKPGTEEINTEKAATTYKNFKSRFNDQMQAMKTSKEEPLKEVEEDHSPKMR